MSNPLDHQLKEKLATARRHSGRNHGLASPGWERWSELGAGISICGGLGLAGLGLFWVVYSSVHGLPRAGNWGVRETLELATTGIFGCVLALGLFVVGFVALGFAAVAVLAVARSLLALCADRPGFDRVASACAAAACSLMVFLPLSFVLTRDWNAALVVYAQKVWLLGCCQAGAMTAPAAYRDLRRRRAGRLKTRARISLAGLLLLTIPVALLLSLLRLIEGGPASITAVLLAVATAVVLHTPVGWLVDAWARRRFRRRRRTRLIRRST